MRHQPYTQDGKSPKKKTVTATLLRPFFEMVRQEGVEPPHLSAPEPKSGVSTNSTTGAMGGYSSRLLINYQRDQPPWRIR